MEGRRCVSLAIGAAASRGLRNIEDCGACQVKDVLIIIPIVLCLHFNRNHVKLGRSEMHDIYDGSREGYRQSRDGPRYLTIAHHKTTAFFTLAGIEDRSSSTTRTDLVNVLKWELKISIDGIESP